MATSPAPNAAAPPGMCPGLAVLGGGTGNGGGGGGGSGGGGGNGGGGDGSGDGGSGDGKDAAGAPDYEKYPECGYASHPVDVVTGRAFTHPITDLELPGPLPLSFRRMYSSKMRERDTGLGFGWGHTFGWEVEVSRQSIRVWNEQGIAVDFPAIGVGEETLGPWGWLIRREAWGLAVDADDGVWRMFSEADESGRRYRLTAIEDRNHNRITLTYERGRLSEVTDSVGRAVRIAATPEGRIRSIEVKNALSQGQWIAFAAYTYDERGDLISATDADGFSSHHAYDDEHRLTLDTDRAGLAFHFVYDREGRCVESWGDYPGRRDPSLISKVPARLADGQTKVKGIHHCRFDYMPGRYTEVADSTQVRRFFGTKHGTLSKRVEGGGVMDAVYRDDGHLMARTDEMNATTVFERDARGRLLRVTDPLGRVTSAERDAMGLVVASTDPAGGVTRVDRDPRGNAVLVADAMGSAHSFRYDPHGLVTDVVSPTGARTRCEYDAHGNLVVVTTPGGGVWRFAYDAFGRLLSRVDPLGSETAYSYSLRGDLLSIRDANGAVTRYAYDGERHLTQVVDPKGRVTALSWGGYHRLCGRKDANGHEIALRYNLEGELVEVLNERGEIHQLVYDPSGKLIREVTFDGRELRYRHDLTGRVIRTEGGDGSVIDVAYDLAGQLVRRTLGRDSSEEYGYDLRGELILAKNPEVEVRFERDALGRVIREIQVVGGREYAVQVEYDPEGERVRRKTSLGHAEEITRGALGERIRTSIDGRREVHHQSDVLGREVARALPGGGWLQHAYDALGRIVGRRAGGEAKRVAVEPGQPDWLGPRSEGVTIESGYRYDVDGELVESWDRRRGRTEYRYDPVGQLLAMVPEKARAEVFRYDATGNLYESDPDSAAREYGRGNRLLRRGNTEYVWDRDGRLVEKRTRDPVTAQEVRWRYSWNEAGLLRSVEGPDGAIVELVYDALARRFEKRITRPGAHSRQRIPVSHTRFVWDGDVLVHEIKARAQAAGDPVVEERTYWFEDDDFEPVAHRERKRVDGAWTDDAWFHYVNDPIGTPERLIAEDGEVACELTRNAWGKTEAAPGARASTPLRFQGQYEDEETGLRYNRWRYYDPELGGFVSPDPLGLGAGLRAYAFAKNAFAWVDPLGLVTAKLRAAMEGSGRPLKKGQTPHHIVPRNDARGELGRKILADTGVGLDEEENGARLWGTHPNQVAQPGHPGRNCAAYHGGDVHSDESYERVNSTLRAARRHAKRHGKDQKVAVKSALSDIGARMETGRW